MAYISARIYLTKGVATTSVFLQDTYNIRDISRAYIYTPHTDRVHLSQQAGGASLTAHGQAAEEEDAGTAVQRLHPAV